MIHSTQGDKEEGKGGEHPRNAFSASALRKKKKNYPRMREWGYMKLKHDQVSRGQVSPGE